ncbi:MAG TPA: tetratricopeptide repeat protein [Micropepsaceae bacterium]|nr:tetratricopeptide repeat protein [Micropepsaceae bacterium]
MDQTVLLRAFEHYKAGRIEPAAELLRVFLTATPFDGAANHLLGGIYYRQGKFGLAREHLERACSAPDATPEMFNNYGAALKALGDAKSAIAAYQRALALDPNYADALNNLGVIYRMQRQPDKAVESFRRAAALKPELAEARKNLRNAYNDVVPAWHFAMMNDKPRNDAYQAAIARLVSGKRVLDIGTGTGLLAMMAARAGAKSVISCEAVAPIAECAREIIAQNGLADRIAVIAQRSTDLAVGSGLAERAGVLITETFSSDLLGEGVLPAIEHAYDQLLTDDAVVIPRGASARAYLIGGAEIEGMLFAGLSNGFDLSPFNDFAPPILAASLNNVAHEALSDDFELLSFDLRTKLFAMESRALSVTVTKSGVAAGLGQWIRLDLDEDNRYENRPSSGPHGESHWTQILHRFPRPLAVEAGGTVRLAVHHDRQQISVELVE